MSSLRDTGTGLSTQRDDLHDKTPKSDSVFLVSCPEGKPTGGAFDIIVD